MRSSCSPQAPLEFELEGVESGVLTLKIDNTNSFTSTDGLVFSWRVILNGAPLTLGKTGGDGWQNVAVAPFAAQVRLRSVVFCVASACWRSAVRRTDSAPLSQASSIVSLGVTGADVASAATSALSSVATARPSELFLEVRAAVDHATAWCDEVRWIGGGRGAGAVKADTVRRCGWVCACVAAASHTLGHPTPSPSRATSSPTSSCPCPPTGCREVLWRPLRRRRARWRSLKMPTVSR